MTGEPLSPIQDVFVGRARELAILGAALGTARERSGRLVIISGEPGIGKTRLVREIADQASERGFRMVWGYCHEEAGAPPYWPWVRIISQIVEPLNPRV